MTWTAKLLWRLPERAHGLIHRLTGGWVIVALRQEATQLIGEKWWYRWERWPNNQRPGEYNQRQW